MVILTFLFTHLAAFVLPPDTLNKKLDQQIMVTATRSSRQLSAVPMPVTIITGEQIARSGYLRLSDVLVEQAGLMMSIEGPQMGLQMQGMKAEHTLILIDGEPLIGRVGGTLDLSRISVSMISRIEIVKGASSSLYGSDAMAGVINIITKNTDQTTLQTSLRYGTNNTQDLQTNAGFVHKKLKLNLGYNYYSSNGYDLWPETYGPTISPFKTHSLNGKLSYQICSPVLFSISGRHFSSVQNNTFMVADAQNSIVGGKDRLSDYSINPELKIQLQPKLILFARYYQTGYKTKENWVYQTDNKIFDQGFFDQQLNRLEVQTNWTPTQTQHIIFGAGMINEMLRSSRYSGYKHNRTMYGFAQHEWQISEKIEAVSGARYDNNKAFGSQLSPKLALGWRILPVLHLKASGGLGFRAPDFRQLYLDFANNIAGYNLFGAREVEAGVERLQQTGQIQQLISQAGELGNLQAERGKSMNIGANLQLQNLKSDINIFRNDLTDLIETRAVARKTNGSLVYSYVNLHQVYTAGIELNNVYTLSRDWSVAAGYQFLQAQDKQVRAKIDKGEVFARDPETLVTKRVSKSEYGGLFQRSKHSGNFRVDYNNAEKGLSASLRLIWRGRFGLNDLNGNLILDDKSEYAAGYQTLNLSINKIWKKHFTTSLGCDNLTGYTDRIALPQLPGRLFFVALRYEFSKSANL